MMGHLKDKYVNPLTDFGFKKLFEATEIAKFTKEERSAYEESLKVYRDLNNVIDTSKAEGRAEGVEEGKIERARNLFKMKMSIEDISSATGISVEKLKRLLN